MLFNWTGRVERAFCCGYARHVTLTFALIARAWVAASGLARASRCPRTEASAAVDQHAPHMLRSAFDFSQISLSKINGWLLTTATATKRCLIAAAATAAATLALPALYLCKNSLWMPENGSKNRTHFCLHAHPKAEAEHCGYALRFVETFGTRAEQGLKQFCRTKNPNWLSGLSTAKGSGLYNTHRHITLKKENSFSSSYGRWTAKL